MDNSITITDVKTIKFVPVANIKLDAKCLFIPKKIIRNGKATIVFWLDGTKTVVKCSDEDDNDYDAFTAALAKRVFGTNSAVKKIVNMTQIQD